MKLIIIVLMSSILNFGFSQGDSLYVGDSVIHCWVDGIVIEPGTLPKSTDIIQYKYFVSKHQNMVLVIPHDIDKFPIRLFVKTQVSCDGLYYDSWDELPMSLKVNDIDVIYNNVLLDGNLLKKLTETIIIHSDGG